jgi:hypothetical protein
MDESEPADRKAVTETLRRINQAWLEGRPRDLEPLIHPEVTFMFPGFAGRAQGSESIVAGFEDFCRNARIEAFQASDHQVDVVADTAVASFRFEMVYQREGSRYRSTGRDLWVFARQTNGWLAVWRTMVEVQEEPA